MVQISQYGVGDQSFQAAGGVEGIKRLAQSFYDHMKVLPETQKIFVMHPGDTNLSIDKLARFLTGWLGGPRLYQEKYGGISIPMAHAHLDISEKERDAWLFCMQRALEDQPYDPTFKEYLLQQLAIPAERIRVAAQQEKNQ